MDTAIVVFTRDLRLHDNPALHLACARARQVVPLFVADPALDATKRSPNRARFLAESLADLRTSLRERGADLARRFDRSGAYVGRYLPELADLDPAVIHTPWKLPPAPRVRLGYPGPLVELT